MNLRDWIDVSMYCTTTKSKSASWPFLFSVKLTKMHANQTELNWIGFRFSHDVSV